MKGKRILCTLIVICLLIVCISCTNNLCKNGHDFDSGTIIKTSTCTKEGEIVYTCLKCKKTKNEKLPLIDHIKDDEWVIDENTHYHLCKMCKVYKFDEEPHQYDNQNTCVCGKQTHFLEKLEKPVLYNTTFKYTGDAITVFPKGFDEDKMTITNNVQTDCGTYQLVISLKDKLTTTWTDGLTYDIVIDYQIVNEKVELKVEAFNENQFVYNGSEQTFLPNGFDEQYMTITNNVQKNVGTYEAIISIIDPDSYIFSNNQTSITLNFVIEKAKLVIPTLVSADYDYNGQEITLKLNNFDDKTMTITNNKQTNIGTYEAVISLIDKDNYCWSDSSTGDILLTWNINEKELTYEIEEVTDNTLEITNKINKEVFSIVLPTNTNYELNQDTGLLTITNSDINEDGLVVSLKGEFTGSLTFNFNEETEIEIELNGVTITSDVDCPLYVSDADGVDISVKKNTENVINDNREAVEDLKSAIYTTCDLKLKGTGTLKVISKNNNGIHSKDDLKLQKLTLYVSSVDNALKGNDGVTITSGSLTLISRQGDGIKTSNTSLSKKDKQKGSVIIEDGIIDIYAACDGIDAAYDLTINGGTISIYTDKYSEYSEEVTKVSEDIYYIRTTSSTYKYSIYYFNTTEDGIWVNSDGITKTVNAGRDTYYYYKMAKPTGYNYLKVYIYTSSQTQGQSSSYYKASSQFTLNANYDTIAYGSSRPGGSSTFSWTTYETVPNGGMGPGGGMGGMQEGNPNKGDYSTKGLKSDNEIIINGGVINITSYDDAIHTNNDVEMESGVTPTGNIIINGGTLTLYSNDDGIHADGTLKVVDGTINITYSYEGLEGTNVEISGGNVSIISSDDGINGTATSATAIFISGGTLYVLAGGDGVDSNSQTSYSGIVFSGGNSVIISYGRSDSSIDTERGYKYTGGYVIGIGMSGGMSSESKNCNNFSSVGKSQQISLTLNNYLVISDVVTLKIPKTMSALVVVLGSTLSTITTSSSFNGTLDSNNVCW